VFEHFATAHEKYKGGENKKKAFVLFGGKKQNETINKTRNK
jgi:hypothetical protein